MNKLCINYDNNIHTLLVNKQKWFIIMDVGCYYFVAVGISKLY